MELVPPVVSEDEPEEENELESGDEPENEGVAGTDEEPGVSGEGTGGTTRLGG